MNACGLLSDHVDGNGRVYCTAPFRVAAFSMIIKILILKQQITSVCSLVKIQT